MKNTILLIMLAINTITHAQVQTLKTVPADDAWCQKIRNLAPAKPFAPVHKKRHVLVFSLFTGFQHWVIPNVDSIMVILGEKSGAYQTTVSNDIFEFNYSNLKKYDAVVLNNNCSVNPRRNLFYDALADQSDMTDKQKLKKARSLEKNLLRYVRRGGGLAVIHGGIVMQNNSSAFSDMVGGSFDYHPAQQNIEVHIVDGQHPITAPFDNKPFSHVDEPYFFKNAYTKKHFKPLLYYNTADILKKKKEVAEAKNYISWIKRYKKGRVFYASPSHNAQSYENPHMLRFYLNGLQYVLGDLSCDDSPIKSK